MLPKLSRQTKNNLTSIAPKGSTPIVQGSPKDQTAKREPTPLDEIAQIPVYATITGSYGDIISLFKALEGYEQLMAISDVNMNSNYDNPNQISSSFSLNLIHIRSAIKHPSYDMLAEILSGGRLIMASEEEVELEQVATGPAKPEEAGQLSARELGANDVSIQPPVAVAKKIAPSKHQTPQKQKPGEIVRTVRYSVKVSATSLEDNMKEARGLLLSRRHDAWMLPFPSTSSGQYNILVGKFATIEEADRIGKLMQNQFSWVSKYEIIEGKFDYDAILKEHRTLR